MVCIAQAQLNVATFAQQRTLGSSTRRAVTHQCSVRAKDARCTIAYGSSASHQLQISAKSYLSGTSVRATVKRSAVQRARVITRAGWNDFEWSEVKIASKTTDSGMSYLTVDVGEEIVKGYTKPGQFVQVRVTPEGKAAFLAIASAPGTTKSTLELLIKPVAGATAGDLCELAAGASVEMSPVMGKGFDISKVPGAKTVLIFATGSGISPIKALIEASAENGGLDAKSRDNVRLYYGAAKESTMAFKERFDAWEATGVNVIPVMSQSDAATGSPAKRYVQDVFIEQKGGPIEGDPKTTAVVLCGQKEMAEAVKAVCADAGIPEENLLTNF